MSMQAGHSPLPGIIFFLYFPLFPVICIYLDFLFVFLGGLLNQK